MRHPGRDGIVPGRGEGGRDRAIRVGLEIRVDDLGATLEEIMHVLIRPVVRYPKLVYAEADRQAVVVGGFRSQGKDLLNRGDHLLACLAAWIHHVRKKLDTEFADMFDGLSLEVRGRIDDYVDFRGRSQLDCLGPGF